MDEFKTPEFARVEMALSGRESLRAAADELRLLASKLEAIATTPNPDSMANYLAWGSIKAASQKLRSAPGKEAA